MGFPFLSKIRKHFNLRSSKVDRDGTFIACKSLNNIVLSASLKSIGNTAFYKCQNLMSINIPSSVNSIGENAFMEFSGLIQIDSVVKYISNQEQHHKQKSFKEEYLGILKKNNVQFSEDYLFNFFNGIIDWD